MCICVLFLKVWWDQSLCKSTWEKVRVWCAMCSVWRERMPHPLFLSMRLMLLAPSDPWAVLHRCLPQVLQVTPGGFFGEAYFPNDVNVWGAGLQDPVNFHDNYCTYFIFQNHAGISILKELCQWGLHLWILRQKYSQRHMCCVSTESSLPCVPTHLTPRIWLPDRCWSRGATHSFGVVESDGCLVSKNPRIADDSSRGQDLDILHVFFLNPYEKSANIGALGKIIQVTSTSDGISNWSSLNQSHLLVDLKVIMAPISRWKSLGSFQRSTIFHPVQSEPRMALTRTPPSRWSWPPTGQIL